MSRRCEMPAPRVVELERRSWEAVAKEEVQGREAAGKTAGVTARRGAWAKGLAPMRTKASASLSRLASLPLVRTHSTIEAEWAAAGSHTFAAVAAAVDEEVARWAPR